MNKQKKTAAVLLCMAAIAITGCGGASKEKIEEAQKVYAQLKDRHNEVIEIYADIEDDSLNQKLDDMAKNIDSIGSQDMKDLRNSEIDDMILGLRSDIAAYDDILASIEQLDTEDKDEEVSVSVTLKNNTGVDLHQIYLYNASREDKGENLVENIEYLGGFQNLNVLNLYMKKDEMIWRVEAIDSTVNVIESAEIDLSGWEGKDVTIQMEFSFDTMEGWLEAK